MSRTAARYLVTIAAALCAWLIASKAEAAASAPACGDAQTWSGLSGPVPLMFPSDDPVENEALEAAAQATATAAATAERDAIFATIAFGASHASLAKPAASDADAECSHADANAPSPSGGAPMCGHHGASVNAPAPFLETAQRANSIGAGSTASPDACSGLRMMASPRPGALHRSAPRPDADPSQPPFAVPPALDPQVFPPSFATVTPTIDVLGARHGVRSTVDRPPRS